MEKAAHTQSRKKAALVEIYDSHDVNLYAQLAFLKAGGYETTLICSQNLANEVKDYDTGQENVFVACTGKKGLALLSALWAVRNEIVNRGISIVIFNTAHSTPIRNLCLMPFPKRTRFFGTLHGVNKLQGSISQKIISRRLGKYFLLSDYMLQKALSMPHGKLQFSVFYPIFHPAFPLTAVAEKPDGELWIGIPGAVEYKRRDYDALVRNFAKLEKKPRVRFLILGNGSHPHGNGASLKELIASYGLQEYFLFYDGFVPNDIFHAYLQQCDALMPLIHPINADMEKYLENQISGTFNIAFAYRKPLLMHEYYNRYEDFRENGVFYNLDNMSAVIAGIKELLAAASTGRYQNIKWTFDYQALHYNQFLTSD